MKFAICFVIGDTEMHNSLCGKYNFQYADIVIVLLNPFLIQLLLKNQTYSNQDNWTRKNLTIFLNIQPISHHPI